MIECHVFTIGGKNCTMQIKIYGSLLDIFLKKVGESYSVMNKNFIFRNVCLSRVDEHGNLGLRANDYLKSTVCEVHECFAEVN